MTIPNLVHLRWAGPDKPGWLREQTIASWKRWMPDCEINLERAPKSDQPAHDADVWRWQQLYERGGWWSDLDIIYYADVRPLATGNHGLWITADGNADQPYSIGLMAAQPGCDLVRLLWTMAAEAKRDDYQACGVRLFHRLWGLKASAEVGRIPHAALYPVPAVSTMMEEMWRHWPDAWMPSHALHWYANFHESRKRENDAPDALFNGLHAIGKALRRSEGKQ